MKRIWIFLASLLISTLVLAGCGGTEELTADTTAANTTVDTAISTMVNTTARKTLTASPAFADTLDDNSFVAGISRDDVDERLARWTYNGKTLDSYAQVIMGDGPFGGTTIYSGDDMFHWTIDFEWNVDESFADYTHTFYFDLPIDGIAMPYGIGFDDGLDDLIKVLEVEVNFSSNQDQLLAHTLIPDYESKLVLTPEKKLVFTEYTEFVCPQSDGEDLHVLVTRSVVLDFESDTRQLKAVTFQIQERRVYNEDVLIDPQTFSHALDRNGFLPEEADYNFWNLLAYCSYEGETLERYIVGRVSNDDNDNDDYSTHIKSNDIFDGNSSHWSASEFNNEKYHVYLTFYRLIEGLAMPYDIAFGDSIDGVLEKLSCSKEPWVAGENAWTMTLSQTKEEGCESTLVLIDYARMPDSIARDLALVFTETYQATYTDGQIFDVTRSVRLGFSDDGVMAITFSITEEAADAK